MPRMRDVIEGKAKLNSRRKRLRKRAQLQAHRLRLKGKAKKFLVRIALRYRRGLIYD
jgi:hypothetical protein